MIHIEHFTFNAFQTRCCVVWDDNGYCAFVDPGCSSPAETHEIVSLVESRDLKPVCIMLTHAHFDHIYGMAALAKEYEIPVYAHIGEMFTLETTNPAVCGAYGLPLPETFPMIKSISEAAFNSRFYPVNGNDTIEVGDLRFEVIETPGHSRGGLCFFERTERILFSGDSLFAGAIGRTDHPGGDYDLLISSILTKLLPLDDSPMPGSSSDSDMNPGSEASSGLSAKRNTSVKVFPGHGPCTDLATEGMTNPFLQPFNEPYDD
jgi:glyoxylase-like metal-dependent hydrolase (beta-lactamase superfamily II)